MKLTTLILALSFSTSLFAGFTKGNGGNILQCTESPNIVLDYFELSELYGLNAAPKLDSPDFFQTTQRNISLIHPRWGQKFESILGDLKNRVRYIETPLESVNDSYVVVLPSNCELKQTAVQLSGRILINLPLFSSLSEIQQKILILHEIIYSIILSERKLDDSRPVRALVSLLISNEFLNMSSIEIQKFLRDNGIYIYP